MWQPYKPGVLIVGRQVRVMGSAMNSVSVTNVASGKLARVAAGLVGSCSHINPRTARVAFRKFEFNNMAIWPKCTGLVHDNSATGLLVVDVIIDNLERFEVGGNA